MAGRLEGKVAIVTGGSTGIGEAISKKFAREGAKVVVNGLPGDPVEQVVGEIQASGGQAAACVADIGTLEGAAHAVTTALGTFGGLDVLINNAGIFGEENEIGNYSPEMMKQVVHTNVFGTMLMTQAAIPHLQKSKGCIVSAGSESALNGVTYFSVYGGSKGFVQASTLGVAAEQAHHGVRANVVAPGPIDTSWTHHDTGPMSFKTEQMMKSSVLMGRYGTPEEVANVYLFLASDEASYVTGSVFLVDGGITIAKSAAAMMADRSMKQEPEGTLDLQHQHEGRAQMR